jgi:hypothetical protein
MPIPVGCPSPLAESPDSAFGYGLSLSNSVAPAPVSVPRSGSGPVVRWVTAASLGPFRDLVAAAPPRRRPGPANYHIDRLFNDFADLVDRPRWHQRAACREKPFTTLLQ